MAATESARVYCWLGRLIEAGVRFVTVKGYVRYGWDHHPEVFPRLRTEVPPYDQGYAALLNDLSDRGMLDNTLVITAGEFGRTPRLNSDPRAPGPRSLESLLQFDAGRRWNSHWSGHRFQR